MFRVFRERQREVVPDDSFVMPHFEFTYDEDFQEVRMDASIENGPVGTEVDDHVHSTKKEEDVLIDAHGNITHGNEPLEGTLQLAAHTVHDSSTSAYSNSPLEKIQSSRPVKKEEPVLVKRNENGAQDESEQRVHSLQAPAVVTTDDPDKVRHDMHVAKMEDESYNVEDPTDSDYKPNFDEDAVARHRENVVKEEEADSADKAHIEDCVQPLGVGASETECNGEVGGRQPIHEMGGNTPTLRGSGRLTVEKAMQLFPIDDPDREELAARLGLMTWTKDGTSHRPDAMACKFCATSETLCLRMRVYCWPYMVDHMLRHLWREHSEDWRDFEQLDGESREIYFKGRLASKELIEDRIEKMECVWRGMVRGETKMKFGVDALRKERMRLQEGEGEEGEEFREWRMERKAAAKRLRERKRRREEAGEEDEGSRKAEKQRRVEVSMRGRETNGWEEQARKEEEKVRKRERKAQRLRKDKVLRAEMEERRRSA